MTIPSDLGAGIAQGSVDLAAVGGAGVELLFTGDLYPGGRTEELLLRGDLGAVFGDVLPHLRDSDVCVTNLESPLTCRGTPIVKTGPAYRSDPACAAQLREAGFDVASLANNHVLDFGAIGLEDTVAACRSAGLHTVGAGGSVAQARAPLVLDLSSCRVAILAFAEEEFSTARDGAGAAPLDPVANYYQVVEAKKQADCVFVVVHGGHEFHPLPSPRMVETYRFLADLGVTAVIAHHPHVASGLEIRNGVPILYSLGTLLFDPPRPEPEAFHKGFFVKLKIRDKRLAQLSLCPYWQFEGGPGLRMMEGDARARFLADLAVRSRVIQDASALQESWKAFCASKRDAYLASLTRAGRLRRLLSSRRLCTAPRLSTKEAAVLLNLLRCQAHREASTTVLETLIAERSISPPSKSGNGR
jgi:poly-gamma-glutamate capsule biosynthesis protein CapA/YwtB (metallophosphatase superfamily)